MWPFRRHAQSAPEPRPTASAAAVVQREPANGWAVVGANVQRAIGPMPLTYLSSGVSEIMPTHHDPTVTGSMGHAVSADGPSGVVRGMATTVSGQHDSWGAPESMSLRQPALVEEPVAPEAPSRWLPVSHAPDTGGDTSPAGDEPPSPVTASDPEPPRLLHATPSPAGASSHHVQRAATAGAPPPAPTAHAAEAAPGGRADHSALLKDLPAGAVIPDQPLTLAEVEARYTSPSTPSSSAGPDLAPPIQPRQVQRRAVSGDPAAPPAIAVSRSAAPGPGPDAATEPSTPVEPAVSRSATTEHFPGDGHDHGEGADHGGPVQRMALAGSPAGPPSTAPPAAPATSGAAAAPAPSMVDPPMVPPDSATAPAAAGVAAPASEPDAPLLGEQPLAPAAAGDQPAASTPADPTVSRDAAGGGAESLGPLAALGGALAGGGGQPAAVEGALGGAGAGGTAPGDTAPVQAAAVQRAALAAPPAAPPAAATSAPSNGSGSNTSLGSLPEEAGGHEEGTPGGGPTSSSPPAAGPPSVGTASDPAVPTLGVTATSPAHDGTSAATAPAGRAGPDHESDLPLTVARLASMPSVQRSAAPVGQRAVAMQARATSPLVSVAREAQPATVPAAVQRMVEHRTGTDLSGVVVHRQTGEQARSMGAHAFTSGGEVHLPAHHGPLDSGPGQSLLAHELTHVAQQRQLGDHRPPESTPGGQALESEARHSELAVAGGAAAPVARLAEAGAPHHAAPRSASRLSVQRQDDNAPPAEQAPEPPSSPPAMTLASPAAPPAAPAEPAAQQAQPPQSPPAAPAAEGAPEGAPPPSDNNIVGATASPVASAPAAAPGGGGAAGAAGGGGGEELDELARKLYDKIRWRMRAELRMDLERGGRGAGINH